LNQADVKKYGNEVYCSYEKKNDECVRRHDEHIKILLFNIMCDTIVYIFIEDAGIKRSKNSKSSNPLANDPII
jgi:hypothetical protein